MADIVAICREVDYQMMHERRLNFDTLSHLLRSLETTFENLKNPPAETVRSAQICYANLTKILFPKTAVIIKSKIKPFFNLLPRVVNETDLKTILKAIHIWRKSIPTYSSANKALFYLEQHASIMLQAIKEDPEKKPLALSSGTVDFCKRILSGLNLQNTKKLLGRGSSGKVTVVTLGTKTYAKKKKHPYVSAENFKAEEITRAAIGGPRGLANTIAAELTTHTSIQAIAKGSLYGLKFDEAAATDFLIQICRAIGYMHQNGFLHRDIKPDNILLYSDDSIKLTDFDLSVRTSLMVEGRAPGTPEFCAPEMWTKKLTSEASDMFALGITLYQLCTGITDMGFASRRDILPAYEGEETSTFILSHIDPLIKAEPLNRVYVVMRALLHPIPEKRLSAAGALLCLKSL